MQDAVDYLKDLHSIEIQLDTKALEEAGIGSDTPVTRTLKGISLRSALRLMLGAMDLTYVIKDEVLLITTTDVASNELVTKAYPVADLVIPIRSMMGGMMGGGMMGGGMGGMGGGMGGMGGGMGGMGGGMGGMGGGMGGMGGGMGGMMNVPDRVQANNFQAFDVPDDLKLTPKPAATKPASKAANPGSVTVKPAGSKPAAAKPAKPVVAGNATKPSATKAGQKVAPIVLTIAEGADANVAWNDYFGAHPETSPEQVRETARLLMHERRFAQAIAMIHAALRNGQPQPWMYEALALAMQAAGNSKQEIERALMSAVDFAETRRRLDVRGPVHGPLRSGEAGIGSVSPGVGARAVASRALPVRTATWLSTPIIWMAFAGRAWASWDRPGRRTSSRWSIVRGARRLPWSND